MLPKKKKIIRILVIGFIVLVVCNVVLYNNFKVYYMNSIRVNVKNQASIFQRGESNKGTTYYVSSDGKSMSGTDINDPMPLSIANR